MKKETKSLQESENEFKKVKSCKDEIADKKLKEQSNKLYGLMIKRYKAHENLSKEYLNTKGSAKLSVLFFLVIRCQVNL